MTQLICEHWQLALTLIISVLLMVFVWVMAGKAVSKRAKSNEAEIKRLEIRKKLREDFKILTKDVLLNANDDVLLDGVTENIIMQLENSDDEIKCFETLNREKRNIYVLSFLQDLAFEDSVEHFFYECAEYIGKYVGDAFKMINQNALSQFFEKVANAYDENNFEVSITDEIKDEFETEFNTLKNDIDLKKETAKFIKENVDKFI